jgi:hypothetical protein
LDLSSHLTGFAILKGDLKFMSLWPIYPYTEIILSPKNNKAAPDELFQAEINGFLPK